MGKLINAVKRRLWFFKNLRYGRFGKKSLIIKPMMITGKNRIFIGDSVTFRDGLRMECISKHGNQSFASKIVIGNNTTFEQGAHITSAGNLTIGNDCVISSLVMIQNCKHSYTDIGINVLKQNLIVEDVAIGDNCFIGMGVKIFPGVRIGKNCIIGANSIVMSDIPDYCVAVGCPAKVIKCYDFERKEWVKAEKEQVNQ